MDGWVRVLRPFNSISVISRWWKGEYERLCAMKHCLGSGRISPPAGFEPVTPWSKVGSANRSTRRTLHHLKVNSLPYDLIMLGYGSENSYFWKKILFSGSAMDICVPWEAMSALSLRSANSVKKSGQQNTASRSNASSINWSAIQIFQQSM